MKRYVDRPRTDVSEELIVSIVRVQKSAAATCSLGFLARGFFCPEDGSDRILRNVGSSATSQKTTFFIVTAVKASNLI
jgi:hypothetical protein